MKSLLSMTPGALFASAVVAPIIALIVAIVMIAMIDSPIVALFILAFIITIPLSVFSVWLYAIATYFHTKLPSDIYINLTRFKIVLALPFILSVLVIISFPYWINLMSDTPENRIILISVLLGIFYSPMFFVAHSIFFALKIMVSAEKQDLAKFGDFAPDFVWTFCFPIGLFWIQPKVIKAFEHFES